MSDRRGIIVTMATPGPYRREADRLAASALRLGLLFKCYELPAPDPVTAASPELVWKNAVRQKPAVLLAARRRHPDDAILYVDADAFLHGDPWPWLYRVWSCDLACHWLRLPGLPAELLTGTIYLPAASSRDVPVGGAMRTRRTAEILSVWQARDTDAALRKNPDSPYPRQPQKILRQILMEDRGTRYRTGELPPELCWIFDISSKAYGDRVPVVEHLQASREYRHPGRQPWAVDARRHRLSELAELAEHQAPTAEKHPVDPLAAPCAPNAPHATPEALACGS